MKTELPPLKLRVYAGRENGLMIIGKPESLSELGRQLQAPAEITASSSNGWPAEVASPRTESPYSDVPEFTLSFHAEPDGGLPASLRVKRRNLQPVAFLLLGGLAIVGAVTVFRWVAGHAF